MNQKQSEEMTAAVNYVNELTALRARVERLEEALEWENRCLCAYLDYAPQNIKWICCDPDGAVSAARAVLEAK